MRKSTCTILEFLFLLLEFLLCTFAGIDCKLPDLAYTDGSYIVDDISINSTVFNSSLSLACPISMKFFGTSFSILSIVCGLNEEWTTIESACIRM